MNFDLQFNDIIVPDLIQDGFGFNCTDDNNCQYLENQWNPCPDQVSRVQTRCRLMKFPFKFDNSTTENEVTSFMNASSISVQRQQWTMEQGEVGYIGLGPSSPFWDYINQVYNTPNGESYHKFSISQPRSQGVDASNYSATPYYQSRATLNSKQSLGKTLKYSTNNVYNDRWTLFNSSFDLSPSSSVTNTRACIDLNTVAYIMIPQQNWISFANNTTIQLCGQNYTEDCHINKSNIAKVSPINVTFEDTDGNRITNRLDPHDFIKFDSNGYYYLLIGQSRASSFCPSDGFVIGRYLAEQYEFTVWSRFNSPSILEVSQLYPDQEANSISWTVAIILATLALLTTIILGVQT